MFAGQLQLLTFVWWVVGQVWVYGSNTCHASNKLLYTYAFVLIILIYVSWLLPLILLLALCICLPCVLLLLQYLQEPQGAPEDVIQNLPTRSWDVDSDVDDGSASEDHNTCAVCTENYHFGDQLRQLPCRHEFHAECVDRWLAIKKECPLCRHDITQPMTAGADADADNQV